MKKILFVDDDAILRETAFEFFSANGFETATADCGDSALEKLQNERFDIIVLDILMPGQNGFEVCREIKRLCNTPVIFLTALGNENEQLKGFSCGACDYITKPYHLSVLLKKCERIIKMYRGENRTGNIIEVGNCSLDTEKMMFIADGNTVPLQGKEYDLLLFFFINPDIVLSRSKIIDNVWGFGFSGTDRIVDTYVKKLRASLGKRGKCIETVKNSGYRLSKERMK